MWTTRAEATRDENRLAAEPIALTSMPATNPSEKPWRSDQKRRCRSNPERREGGTRGGRARREQANCGGMRTTWAEPWTSGVFDRRRSGRTWEPNRCGIIRQDVARMPVREGTRRRWGGCASACRRSKPVGAGQRSRPGGTGNGRRQSLGINTLLLPKLDYFMVWKATDKMGNQLRSSVPWPSVYFRSRSC